MFPVGPVEALDAHGGLLRLLEPLVLTVSTVLVLNHRRSFGHLLPVEILLIPDQLKWKFRVSLTQSMDLTIFFTIDLKSFYVLTCGSNSE